MGTLERNNLSISEQNKKENKKQSNIPNNIPNNVNQIERKST